MGFPILMDKRKILIQLDSDAQPSVFDRVVAIDAGAEEILSYGAVKPDQVAALVHGAIFTRGGKQLKNTALFVGGSDVTQAEKLLEEAQKHMLPQFGLRVSLMLDANGANTTAAAAVRAAARHVPLRGAHCLVLGGTGPVGQRVARLLAGQGAHVRLASRQIERARAACKVIQARLPNARIEPASSGSTDELSAGLRGVQIVVAAGAAGALLLPRSARQAVSSLHVVIDLNAVPPAGIEGVQVTDNGREEQEAFVYGAIGIGGTKMKLHKAAIAKLFTANDLVLDAEKIYELSLDVG